MYIYNASPNLNNSTPAKFNQVIIADGILTLDRKCKFNLENGTRGEGGVRKVWDDTLCLLQWIEFILFKKGSEKKTRSVLSTPKPQILILAIIVIDLNNY